MATDREQTGDAARLAHAGSVTLTGPFCSGTNPVTMRYGESWMTVFTRWGDGAAALRVLSLFMGVFLIFMGLGKTAWFGDSGHLVAELRQWREFAPSLSRWYLDTVAIPGAPLFARLVPVGELSTGAALVLGVRTGLAATVALAMILNFHVAMGVIFTYGYLTNGYGLPVVGALLALAVGGARLPFSLYR